MTQPGLSRETLPLPPAVGLNADLLTLAHTLLYLRLARNRETIKFPFNTRAQLEITSPPRFSVPYTWQRYEGKREQWPRLNGTFSVFGLILFPGAAPEAEPRAVFGAVHTTDGNRGVLLGEPAVNRLARLVGMGLVYAGEI